MYNFTAQEIEILLDALTMAEKSNQRMQTAKPKYHAVFTQILTDITAIKLKLQTAPLKTK